MPAPESASLTPEDWELLTRRFEAARGATEAERRRIVDELAASDPRLAGELRAMLGVAERGVRLEVEEQLLAWRDESLGAGRTIGPYRIERRLAKGGMGEVYLAQRIDGGFSQQVAIKLLRPGLESVEMLERFRLERDLLARLIHPSVVPLLDAGTTAEGRPYLVLQYVEGEPITDYCARRGLDARRRAVLLLALCRAVQFAHTNLVVHRDLKPSNVLVTPDGDLRLLDFGIAKLLGERQGPETTRSAGNAPMTHSRAAPEQRRGEPVSTATDVWALGLLLHELLAGELPRRSGDGPEDEPEVVAGAGGLDRDLAAITRKALQLGPENRYASAGEMGEDIRRWLSGAPVRARPDSLAYRAGRFLRRHRAAALAAAGSVLALLALAVVSTVQSIRVREQRDRATAEERKARAVVDLLVQTFGSTDPQVALGEGVTRVEDVLDLAESRAGLLDGEPEVQSQLRAVLGRVRLERGEYGRARELLESARVTEAALFGSDDPRTISVRTELARVLHAQGDREAAEKDLSSCLAILEATPDPDSGLLARVLYGLGAFDPGAQGLERLRRAVELARREPTFSPVDVSDFLSALGVRLQMADRRPEAAAVFREALELALRALGSEDPRTLALRSNLSQSIPDLGERLAEQRSILDSRIRRLGADSNQTATSWLAVGSTLSALGRPAEALEAFERGYQIRSLRSGPRHPVTLAALGDLARAAVDAGEIGRALELYAELEEGLAANPGRGRQLEEVRAQREALRSRPPGTGSDAP